MNPLLPLVNLNEHENFVLQTQRAGREIEQTPNTGFKQAMDSQTRDKPARANEANRSSEKDSPQPNRENDVAENKSNDPIKTTEKESSTSETKASTNADNSTKTAKDNTDATDDDDVNSTGNGSIAADAEVDQAKDAIALDNAEAINQLALGINNTDTEIVSDVDTGLSKERGNVNSVLVAETSISSADRVLFTENQNKLSTDPIINPLTNPLNKPITENASVQLQPLGLQNSFYSKWVTTAESDGNQDGGLKKSTLSIDTQALVDKNVVALDVNEKFALKTDVNTTSGVSNTEKNFLFQRDIITLKNELPVSINDTATTSTTNKSTVIHSLMGNAVGAINSTASSALVSTEGRVQLPVSITFGQSGWGNMIAERSAMMASQNIKFAELQLDPPELGPLQVKVSITQDQASVSFVAANAQVRESLDQAQARLRELLDEQGLNLVNVDVSDDSSNQSDNSSDGDDADTPAQLVNATEEDASKTVQIEHNYGVDHYV